MSNKLIWLLRHAKADSGDEKMDDIDRPLSHKGRQQAMRLGEWMQQHDLRPTVLISSPAVRARQTTELVCRPLGFDMNNVYFDPGLYLASRNNLVEIIAAQSLSEGSIMLVGHNPGLEDLLTWLCHEPLPRNQEGKLLTTANLARIQLDETGKLAKGNGRLIELTRANELA